MRRPCGRAPASSRSPGRSADPSRSQRLRGSRTWACAAPLEQRRERLRRARGGPCTARRAGTALPSRVWGTNSRAQPSSRTASRHASGVLSSAGMSCRRLLTLHAGHMIPHPPSGSIRRRLRLDLLPFLPHGQAGRNPAGPQPCVQPHWPHSSGSATFPATAFRTAQRSRIAFCRGLFS